MDLSSTVRNFSLAARYSMSNGARLRHCKLSTYCWCAKISQVRRMRNSTIHTIKAYQVKMLQRSHTDFAMVDFAIVDHRRTKKLTPAVTVPHLMISYDFD